MPYQPMDDYLIHQAPIPLDQVVSGHPHWTDRFYFNIHPKDGSSLITCGGGIFPNARGAHIYGKVSLADGRYWDISAVEQKLERSLITKVGAFTFETLEPMKRWRLLLAENESGVSWDIEYKARAPLWHLKPIYIEKAGKIIVQQQHIQQSGYFEGEVKFGSETLSVDGFYGGRDRTWGIRDHANVDMWIWFAAQFEDRAIAAWLWESKDGTIHYVDGGFCHEDGTLSKRFTRFEPKIEFDGLTKKPLVAEVLFVDEDGREYNLKAKQGHKNVCVYYGGTPASRDNTYPVNMNDPAVQNYVSSVSVSNDKLMQYELDGMSGWGIFETWVCGDGYDKWANSYPLIALQTP